jgi:hypothetical protein
MVNLFRGWIVKAGSLIINGYKADEAVNTNECS